MRQSQILEAVCEHAKSLQRIEFILTLGAKGVKQTVDLVLGDKSSITEMKIWVQAHFSESWLLNIVKHRKGREAKIQHQIGFCDGLVILLYVIPSE